MVSVTVTTLFQNTTDAGQSFLVNSVEVISAFNGVGASYSVKHETLLALSLKTITSMSLSEVAEHGLLRILGIYVGKLLVDTGVIDTGLLVHSVNHGVSG